ncbi:hypothetical protein F1D05_13050 [Kribbella qitaiheensis]|uniref:Uncharacterized protein n=1 Tax=Kribbella qitaiheensis TaxID=1544730 RepID=A0A7G6WXF2_9ACTN|nr:hypothetical protein [Kribbella qitaiheensis]QNE18667.1 hypothetical protein F1D05_13050 [Kribbella qitaiheensis]
MRAETSATSAVVTLSVAVAVTGHVLVPGGSVPLAVVPQLLALAGACWLLGEFLAGRRSLAIVVLAGVQLVVHLTLGAAHQEPVAVAHVHEMPMDMDMPMPMATEPPMHAGFSGALAMTAAHLLALLASVFVIGRAHGWVTRVLRILARLVPEVPAGLIVVPGVRRLLIAVQEPRRTQRWLNSNGSRRGPPAGQVLLASS